MARAFPEEWKRGGGGQEECEAQLLGADSERIGRRSGGRWDGNELICSPDEEKGSDELGDEKDGWR
eukprot:2343880-Rhodomonas_salina.1